MKRLQKAVGVLSGRRGAFTLLELLAAMAILAIIAVIAGWMLLPGPSPARLKSGVSQAAALFNQARAIADARQTSARVLISRNPEEPDKNLRFMVVTYYERGESPEDSGWVPAGNGMTLPQSVYFVPFAPPSVWWDPVTRLDDPRKRKGTPWTAYTFSGSGGSGGTFFLSNTAVPVDPTKPLDPAHLDGFLVRRNGYLTFFSGVDQIKAYLEAQKR